VAKPVHQDVAVGFLDFSGLTGLTEAEFRL
jgi:hypothetical protein